MKNKRLILLVLAALALALLLTFALAPREGGRYGESPVAPAPEAQPPAPPAKKMSAPARRIPAVKKSTVNRRKLRVSTLGDPGEAMGGGVRLDLPEETTGQMKGK